MKQSAIEAVKASNPCAVMFGEIVSESPLKISVEQKLELTEDHLILTKAVTDHYVDISVSHYTVNDNFLTTTHSHPPNAGPGSFDSTHKHKYSGRKKIMIHNGLKQGEKVVMIRLQGGQSYLVLDRVEDPNVEGEWV